MYDTQAMGLLGLNAALAAAAVAGDRLLGHLWWMALIGLLIAGALTGSALFIRAEEVGLDLPSNMGIAEAASSGEMDRAIVVALGEAIDLNDLQLEEKRDRVSVAMVSLVATIAGSIIGVLIF